MSTEMPGPAPAPGFFGLLAERQLAQNTRPATGSLRPWLPYSFDGPSSAPELEPAPAPFRPDATDVPEHSPVPRRPERDDVERAVAQSPLPTAKTGAFTESNDTAPRPPVNRDFTTAPMKATLPRPVDLVERAKEVLPTWRAAPSTIVAARAVPAHGSGTSIQTEFQHHTHERVVAVERAAHTERPMSLPPQPRSAQDRDIPPTQRVAPRVPLPAAPFRRQRETEPEPTIEIHIGRLEVRAQTGPAIPFASDATASPDQRLAAYLRRRGNGARS